MDVGLIDKYKAVDEPDKRSFSERLRRVRRKPGLDQLGAQTDGVASPAPRKGSGHRRAQTWSDSSDGTSNGAQSLLQSIQQLDLESAERRQRKLAEQQALWEATVPKPLYLFIERRSPERT